MTQCMTVPFVSNPKSVTAGHDAVKTVPQVPSHGRTRIMIVDDDHLMRHSIIRLISLENDLEVVGEASNGKEAVKNARVLRPDVVIMDVRMPLMDGIVATFMITEERPETFVIGLTAVAERQSSISMMNAGAVCLLDKVDAATSLLPMIKRLVLNVA